MIRFTSRLVAVALIVVLLGVVWIASAQDDTIEINPVENGETVTGTFDDRIDGQLHFFFGSRNDSVTVFMSQIEETSLLDPYLVLLDVEGRVLAADNDGGETPYFSALIEDYTLPADGLYIILATHAQGLRLSLNDVLGNEAATGFDYELTVSGITTPEDDDALTDFEPAILTDSITVEIDAAQAVAFALVEGEADETLTLGTESADGVDTILSLFDPAGARVAINDDRDGALTSAIQTTLDTDGIYLVLVTGYGFEETTDRTFEWGNTGSITLTR